ncbi:GNAT family N-acetyltransferase [Catenuloplanes japonicus]|uniref:GNAT family N-acetyltransferase n=1 Tax=Catenuloplanes japonicus TaxID=33876 RepID=UPI000525B0D8|nr:GNAT family N-acetyltransferase [Catenuloplanes japonicus]
MNVRLAQPGDAAVLAALRLKIYPHLVRGEAATRRLIESPPPGADMASFVAVMDSQVVGAVAARRNTRTSEPGVGELMLLHVAPAFRGRGLGGALFSAGVAHLRSLAVQRVRSYVPVDGLAFAEHRGFLPSREGRNSRLDLATFRPSLPPVPAGYTLTPVSALPATALYQAELDGAADEPGDVGSEGLTFDAWRYDVWDDPGLDRSLSMAVLAPSGEVASLSLLLRDGDRAWTDMTATLPAHRGRGLARLAKTEALARAAAAGVRWAFTANDASNAPMLAINNRLGYQPFSTMWSCLAALTP